MIWFIAICTLPACLISYSATWLVRRVAPRWGLVDQPAARKVHVEPTPLGGGIGIFFGFLLPITAAQVFSALALRSESLQGLIPDSFKVHLAGVQYRAGQLWTLLACATLLVVMGLIDDRYGLSWKLRLVIQFLVAILLVATGTSATLFVSVPLIGQIVSVIWIVLLINSLNFLDNMDGLSAGIGLIAAVMFSSVMLTATGEPRWLVGGCLLILSGSLAGFLFHNWPPARIFMGDAGSTFIGMMLASLTILGTFFDQTMTHRHVMLAPLFILAIPLYDFTTVMLIRLSSGKSPFQPDKNHFSHRLTELGFSKRNAVLLIHFATLTTGLGALLLYRVDDWKGASLILALVLCLLVIVSILEIGPRAKKESASEQKSLTEQLENPSK